MKTRPIIAASLAAMSLILPSALAHAQSSDAEPAATLAEAEGFDPSRFRGQVLLLDFWASWCVPCGESFPWIQEMKDRYAGQGLAVVTVNLDAERAAADAFLDRHPLDAPHFFDPEGKLAEAYGLTAMPTTLLFDREGTIAFRHEGFRTEKRPEYERHILDLLEKLASRAVAPAEPAPEKTRAELGARPWQRHHLSRKSMLLDGYPLDVSVDDHIYFSKEASSGGRGFGGGGCGCN